jgi:hypothetical protein
MTQNSPPEHRWSSMEAGSHNNKTRPIKLYENPIYRGMRLWRDSLRIHSRTDDDASLSLSRLPAIQRRTVFVVRDCAGGSFQAFARLATLPCVVQCKGRQDQSGFCPECGSPILVKTDPNPNTVAIRTASLDDPSWFNLQVDVWTSDAHPWDQMNPALPKYERYLKS